MTETLILVGIALLIVLWVVTDTDTTGPF